MIALRKILASIARSAGTAAAIVTFACVAALVGSHIHATRQSVSDKERLKVLTDSVKQDINQTPKLQEELDRQRDASLVRQARIDWLSNALILSAIVFLSYAKARISLSARRPPDLVQVVAHRTAGPRRLSSWLRRRRPAKPAEKDPLQLEVLPAEDAHVDGIIDTIGRQKRAVIPLLHAIQLRHNYLAEPALRRLCERTEITPAQVFGVASFYTRFRRTPVGKHIARVCHGTACHVAGARALTDQFRRYLGIPEGDDTDPKRQFTIEEVACLGCCTLAPVVQIEETTYGHLMPDSAAEVIGEYLEAAASTNHRAVPRKTAMVKASNTVRGEIRIGLGSCCVAGGSEKVFDALTQTIEAIGVDVAVKRVGCVGMCHRTPLVEVMLPGEPPLLHVSVRPEEARAIVKQHFQPNGQAGRLTKAASKLLERVLGNGNETQIERRPRDYRDPPVAAFLDKQKHITTEHCASCDPTDLDEYILNGGFEALRECVANRSAEEIIDEIKASGLRGRGGAGFPTGIKWSKVREAAGPIKYVICNGDEGDPGAFMDRMLMESVPYRIIEGLAIAAVTVGAEEGFFYIRAEYPLAVKRIREALQSCEERGLLGDNILGRGIRLHLSIVEGAGAFVCGEETALIASIEGDRGSPRLRPPFPAESGLWGCPTLLGNVESLATVPWIIRNGAAALAELGTETSKGTKVFALAGKIKRGGLIEVPMGITIREIVYEIGGGMKNDRTFKAVQIGGPSGGCIPARLADTPVDYEALTEVGAIMGSGGLVVLDETDCMVDMARYFLSFTQDQSCGKCTFCRIGTRKMLDILEAICAGKGTSQDLDALEHLAKEVCVGSLCGLGRTAPNPVLSTLRYFREEYDAHLEGRCPAGKCTALIEYRVTGDCTGCTLCAQHCPADAIAYTPYQRHEIDTEKCTCCDICRVRCPENAIEVV